jgi:uncharacterized protein YegL
MTGERIDAVQQAVVQLTNELLSSPMLGDQVRVGIVAFNEDAELVVPLSDLTELRRLPRLGTGGTTHFGPAFRLLSRVIQRDRRALRAQDTVTYQPFVFLITDGVPVDRGWGSAYAEFSDLTGSRLVLVTIGPDYLEEGSILRLNPVQTLRWTGVHNMGLAEWLLSGILQYANSLTRSIVVEPRLGESFRMPPGLAPLGESDLS